MLQAALPTTVFPPTWVMGQETLRGFIFGKCLLGLNACWYWCSGKVSPSFGPDDWAGQLWYGSLVQADDPWCGYAHPNLE